MLRRAIGMDHGYARAHALLGWALWWAAYYYWLPDRPCWLLAGRRRSGKSRLRSMPTSRGRA